MKEAVTTASEVARHIIWYAHDVGSLISNLKLQKLLYYAYGWHWAIHKKTLFSDPIEAWINGPVVAQIYGKYKENRYNPISNQVIKPMFNKGGQKHLKGFLKNFLAVYLPLDALKLQRATHNELPWIEARGNLPPDEPSRNHLNVETIRNYFIKWHEK